MPLIRFMELYGKINKVLGGEDEEENNKPDKTQIKEAMKSVNVPIDTKK